VSGAGRGGRPAWDPEWERSRPHGGLHLVEGHELRLTNSRRWSLVCPIESREPRYLALTLRDAVDSLAEHLGPCRDRDYRPCPRCADGWVAPKATLCGNGCEIPDDLCPSCWTSPDLHCRGCGRCPGFPHVDWCTGGPLAEIPAEIRLHDQPQFCRLPRAGALKWYAVGPAALLPIGEVAEVTRFRDDPARVRVVAHIAERTVCHREGTRTHERLGESTRYVIARIHQAPREDQIWD
jgi:hypothetical protein